MAFILIDVIIVSCCITSFAANYESEPNNSISQANTISINTTYYATGDKNSNTDDDYYKFTIDSDGFIPISTTKDYDSGRIYMEIIKYDGSKSSTLLDEQTDYTSELYTTSKLGLSKGTYFLILH